MNPDELKDFMDLKVAQYNQPRFLKDDPLQIPRRFSRKEDIEISGFLTATISWGNRRSIIHNAGRMMQLMDMAPFDFVMQHQESDLLTLNDFVHRTFNGTDLVFFIRALKHLYTHKGGLEVVFSGNATAVSTQVAISALKKVFFEIPHPQRTTKHLPDPARGSAAKRLNMFLRWMVRDGSAGVDFGIWKQLAPSQLSCPLDVHSGNVARKLGILNRRQNDARAVEELDMQLRIWDPEDPARYDFALFGLGVFENWS
jgi:uncharacterized protein (TIGR02757 family)